MHPRVAMLRKTLRTTRKPAGYPLVFNHLGDHIRAKRLDLGLQIKQLARQLGTDEGSVASWEQGGRKPSLRKLPKVLGFLGYDSRPNPCTFGGRLRKCRTGLGLSTRQLSARLDVDASTLKCWERGEHAPIERHRQTIISLLGDLLLTFGKAT